MWIIYGICSNNTSIHCIIHYYCHVETTTSKLISPWCRVSELGQHCFGWWLVACSAPSHYLNQYCLIANWTLRNKLQWNLNHNTKLFIHENAFKYIVCEMTTILSGWRWVNFIIWMVLCHSDVTQRHYRDVIMSAMASQITSLTIVYSTVYSGADQRKHQSPASLAFVSGVHRWPVNSPHKGPVTRKMFPFDHVIMSHVA